MKKLLVLALFAILVLGSQALADQQRQKASHNDENDNSGPYEYQSDWSFNTGTIYDNRTDEDAFSFDVPEDWSFGGEVTWFDDPIPLYTSYFVVYSDDETTGFATLPMQNYVWWADRSFQRLMPEGTQYYPSTIVLRPVDAAGYLEDYLAPTLRDAIEENHEVRHWEIGDIEDRPDVADAVANMIDPEGLIDYYEYDAAEAYVTYEQDGTPIEMKVDAVIGTHEGEIPFMGLSGDGRVTYWSFIGGTVMTAQEGDLENMEPVYQDILHSVQWEQDFLDAYWDIHQEAYDQLQQAQEERNSRYSD